MLQGPVEYLIVSGYGRTHGSILRTPAEPFHVHLAMLLRDAKAGALPTNQPAAPGLRPPRQPGQILAPAAQPLAGDRVHIEVEWERGGRKVRQPAGEFITHAREGRAMSDGPWTYGGGQVVQGFFTPQQQGSIAAVITDPDPLVNNPRAGHEHDDIRLANTNAIPPLNTPVQVILQLR